MWTQFPLRWDEFELISLHSAPRAMGVSKQSSQEKEEKFFPPDTPKIHSIDGDFPQGGAPAGIDGGQGCSALAELSWEQAGIAGQSRNIIKTADLHRARREVHCQITGGIPALMEKGRCYTELWAVSRAVRGAQGWESRGLG